MATIIKLKNSDCEVTIDDKCYEFITTDEYLVKVNFAQNLRRHSSGYAFFQKNWRQPDGRYNCETIYLHKLLAEKFLEQPKSERRLFVRFNDGTPMNCLLENLTWTTLSNVVRNTNKTENRLGYRGVIQDRKRFRAIIYVDRKPLNLGIFDTAEEAAEAYNQKSRELFGETRSINVIKGKE
ncbi:MAG: Pathogenesis-related transcriptional factor and ERF protein [Uliginosibacterium sp.]|nr:Pathogenesis-related transcriptional factor and ERF protein [Uliginosibacterium sp.]